MSYNLVLDASTLILLAKAEILPLVLESDRVAITTQVKEEATRRPELFDAQMISQLISQGKIEVRPVDPRRVRRLSNDFRLDVGEASSAALAQKGRAVLGVDDRLAIRACRVLNVPFVTAIHLLMEAYRRRRLDRTIALVKLEKLQRFGRYDSRILEDAIRQFQGGQSE